MNKNIDLTKILKNCPKGTQFYSSTHGTVTLNAVTDNKIVVLDYRNYSIDYSKDGRYFPHIYKTGECTIFPSKDQKDWSKFTAPWYKKEKFNPKTLKPFDRVIVRFPYGKWKCGIFSHIIDGAYKYEAECAGCSYRYCIPYNDDTKHLVGTKEEAPEYYRYWED